ncbi:gastrula zinc finger protein xFG20-1 isoform X3 [Etheostoma spectabile]|uniref:gastrula zinc finger protein xFG20-1 isoform X3 n=1 Tax=Etheostoma spectabile TaxID=54343 RepID=UPI0013AF2B62|nr:gastrula zinc finger protein xFG20-1-like isoform X3 [Etheostoma spectabile]
MSKVQMLRGLVEQRLTAAAEEIFGLFERTIAEYEEELCRLKEENEQQRKRLDAVFSPQLRLHRADVQELLVVKAEVPLEQQGWSSSMDQEDPDPPHTKEEQEQLWTSQEGEQLQGLEEADIKFPFTTVPEKSKEDDEEKAQSSQLHESQTEENREAERKGPDGEDCGGQEPARNSDPDSPLQPAIHDKTSDSPESQSETDDSADWGETREPQTGLNPLPNNVEPVSDVGCNTGNTSVSSSECTGSFGRKKHLQKPSGVQTGEKPFSCSVFGQKYLRKTTLTTHMKLHSKEKCSTCLVCKASFCQPSSLVVHMRIHTGERPFSCSICGKRFTQKQHLKQHLASHTGEKPFSCSVCSKGFALKHNLRQHLTVHTGEKPFSCSVCSKTFTDPSSLRRHMVVHTGEKSFSCSVCDQKFALKQTLRRHLTVHTSAESAARR